MSAPCTPTDTAHAQGLRPIRNLNKFTQSTCSSFFDTDSNLPPPPLPPPPISLLALVQLLTANEKCNALTITSNLHTALVRDRLPLRFDVLCWQASPVLRWAWTIAPGQLDATARHLSVTICLHPRSQRTSRSNHLFHYPILNNALALNPSRCRLLTRVAARLNHIEHDLPWLGSQTAYLRYLQTDVNILYVHVILKRTSTL